MLLVEFHPYVAPEVIGCPAPLVDQALRMVAIEFCRETKCWTDPQDPIQLVNDVNEYELDTPSQAMVYTVRDVLVGSRRLQPVTMADLQNTIPDWLTAKGSEPSHYNMAGERPLLRVYPMPSNVTGQTMVVRASFTPTMSATGLPDFLGQRHLDAITSGAKARLMAMPGVDWSNPNLAVYYRGNFDQAVLNTRIEEAHERVPGTIRVQPRSFGF